MNVRGDGIEPGAVVCLAAQREDEWYAADSPKLATFTFGIKSSTNMLVLSTVPCSSMRASAVSTSVLVACGCRVGWVWSNVLKKVTA